MTRGIIKGIYLKELLFNYRELKRFGKLNSVLSYREQRSLESLIDDLASVEFQLDILDSALTTFDNVGSAYKVINVDMSSLND